MNITAALISKVAAFTEAEWIQKSKDVLISQIITDSRTIFAPETSLFIAIKGERHDGHQFIEELYRRGIRNFLISDAKLDLKKYPDANILLASDSLVALQNWAKVHRSKFNYPVIAITGSNGKTIVKEWLFQLLRNEFSIVRSPKSYNSQLGVPLSVLQMNETHTLGIFEAGISFMNEMQKLESILKPNLGIFITLSNAHSENFDSEEVKAKEKSKLFSNCETVIFNADNDLVEKSILSLSVKNKISVGHQRLASLLIEEVIPSAKGTTVNLKFKTTAFKIQIPFFDRASIEDAMLCVAVMLNMNYEISIIQERISSIGAVEMRLEMINGINNCTIISDVYNSDISSLGISLDLLNQQKQVARKTIILSDILQEKMSAQELYGKVAEMIKEKNISRFIGIGSVISAYANLFPENSEFYSSTAEFLSKIHHSNFQNEAILIKGARKFELEKITERLQQKVHETVLEINLNAVAHNLNHYRSQLYPNTKIMAMVKAFSYGSGSFEIANILEYNRADYLAVAYADEGADLRNNGITLPIMVMNPEKNGFTLLIEKELEPEIYSMKLLNDFISYLKSRGIKNYPVHLKVDTGMHRLGFMPNEWNNLAEIIKNSSEIKIVSVFSHLAASEDQNFDKFTNEQASLLQKACEIIKTALGYDFLIHILNSSGITRFPKYHFNMVRLGIGLYGVGTDEKENKKLQFTMRMRTVVSQIKTIPKGDTIGYGRKGVANKEMQIAILPIGYADGFSRQLGNGIGEVKINEKNYRVIGNVCMDMIMVDITGGNVKEGDQVIIFDDQQSLLSLAKSMETIPYEVLTSVSSRVKRVYFRE
jgi:alanine racemase